MRAVLGVALGLLTLGEIGQLVGLMIVLVTFLYVGRQKTWRNEAEAQEKRADRLQKELKGAQDRADSEHEKRRDCERQVSHLEGEIKTLERYTAQEALTQVAQELHTTRETIVTAIGAQGDLVMQNTAILTKLETLLGAEQIHPPGG